MITRNDLIVLLGVLEKTYPEAKKFSERCLKNNSVDMEALRFINQVRPMDITLFYEKIRKSYNEKHSKLYLNIMKEITETVEVIKTLSALLTQICIFSETIENKLVFLRHARADEIAKVIAEYVKTGDAVSAIRLLKLIKADIKVLEMTYRA